MNGYDYIADQHLSRACELAATKCFLCGKFGHQHEDCPARLAATPKEETKEKGFWAGFWPESWT